MEIGTGTGRERTGREQDGQDGRQDGEHPPNPGWMADLRGLRRPVGLGWLGRHRSAIVQGPAWRGVSRV